MKRTILVAGVTRVGETVAGGRRNLEPGLGPQLILILLWYGIHPTSLEFAQPQLSTTRSSVLIQGSLHCIRFYWST